MQFLEWVLAYFEDPEGIVTGKMKSDPDAN
jgi:hypothetical protein